MASFDIIIRWKIAGSNPGMINNIINAMKLYKFIPDISERLVKLRDGLVLIAFATVAGSSIVPHIANDKIGIKIIKVINKLSLLHF